MSVLSLKNKANAVYFNTIGAIPLSDDAREVLGSTLFNPSIIVGDRAMLEIGTALADYLTFSGQTNNFKQPDPLVGRHLKLCGALASEDYMHLRAYEILSRNSVSLFHLADNIPVTEFLDQGTCVQLGEFLDEFPILFLLKHDDGITQPIVMAAAEVFESYRVLYEAGMDPFKSPIDDLDNAQVTLPLLNDIGDIDPSFVQALSKACLWDVEREEACTTAIRDLASITVKQQKEETMGAMPRILMKLNLERQD